MPTILANGCLRSVYKITRARRFLSEYMIWSRTHEGDIYWSEVCQKLDDIVAYARAHPEAVQTDRRSNIPFASSTSPPTVQYIDASAGLIAPIAEALSLYATPVITTPLTTSPLHENTDESESIDDSNNNDEGESNEVCSECGHYYCICPLES